ncbi:MAG: hypothetical protein JWP61_1207 [Friedmanniella sp.]|nr:hypothetical protein [Friedmanniella sp.]
MPWVDAERSALVATLRSAAPDAPTLCEGWDVSYLLAHLVAREQSLPVIISDAVAGRPPGQERQLGHLAATTATEEGHQALVTRFLDGPPRWSPMSWAAEQINLVEYVVHHEDIRRAGEDPAAPRTLPAAELAAIWKRVQAFGVLGYRSAPVGVTLATPTGERKRVRRGTPEVTLTGDAVELALYVSGRREVARVEVSGSDEAQAAFAEFLARS